MLWILLLLAVSLIYLALTQRLRAMEDRVLLYIDKAKAAFEFVKEDVQDIEAELTDDVVASVEAELENEVARRRQSSRDFDSPGVAEANSNEKPGTEA